MSFVEGQTIFCSLLAETTYT